MTGRSRFTALSLPLLLAATLLVTAHPRPAAAAGTCCPLVTEPFPSSPANEVIQEFYYKNKMHTAWKVQFAHADGRALYITGAWFRLGPGKPWMRILNDLRLAEIFVPYHPGSPRYYDLGGFGFPLIRATPADTGCCGEIIDSYVVKEVRSTGVTWKNDQNIYRGSALVLWSTIDAANYNYIVEYTFRDDGTIEFALGATARNLPGIESVAHMHLGLWRIDIDLNGAGNDRATLVRHIELPGSPSATDREDPFNGGLEGSANWVPEEFTTLRITDTQTRNGNGHPTSFDLMPARSGNARHQEGFSAADFWVTPYRASELDYTELPNYVANRESIDNTDIVVWHQTPAHHLPRDEDGIAEAGAGFNGSALVMWGRAMLRPRNLFNRTPFYPY